MTILLQYLLLHLTQKQVNLNSLSVKANIFSCNSLYTLQAEVGVVLSEWRTKPQRTKPRKSLATRTKPGVEFRGDGQNCAVIIIANLREINTIICIVVVDQFTPAYLFTPTP